MQGERMKYAEKKERIREQAREWKEKFSESEHYYSELSFWQDYFTRLGKRYGLLREFRENGII